MKIFDRYIVVSFLKNYALSFVVLVGLYIALDMVFNFDELARGAAGGAAAADAPTSGLAHVATVIWTIADYYFYQMFAFFVQLSGVIPVVAAAFTLVRMMRLNELTAMLAAGVPMLRIAAPVVAVGMVMSLLLVADQELIIPGIAHKLVREHDEAGKTRQSSFPITALEDSAGSLLLASRYTPPGYDLDGRWLPPQMKEVDIIEFGPDKKPVAHIQGREAIYDIRASGEGSKTWKLIGATRQTGLNPADPVRTSAVSEWKTNLGPNEIALYKRSNSVEFLSTRQIDTLLEHPRNYGTVPLLRVKHWRFVQPLTNVLLLLLAIPCILTREPNALKATATKTVLVTGACLALVFVSHQFAGRPPVREWTWFWPALMLWLPIFVFAPLAAWNLERLKT